MFLLWCPQTVLKNSKKFQRNCNFPKWFFLKKHQIWLKNTVFSQKIIFENYSFSKTSWNFQERFEFTRVKTSNIVFIVLLDHQAAHIYTYMGQNILMILRVLGTRKLIYVTKAKIVELWKENRILRMNEI